MIIEQAVQEFLLAREAEGLSPETIKTYASILRQIADRLRGKHVDVITTNDIRTYLAELRAQGTRYKASPQRPEVPGPLSIETLRSRIRQLKVFFNWCEVEYELASVSNPMHKIKLPRSPQHAPKAIDLADLERMLDAVAEPSIQDVRDRALILFLADTGARAGGVCSLTPDRLDLDRGLAIVYEKGDRARAVPFTRITATALTDWLNVRPPEAKTVFCALGPAVAAKSHGGILTPNGLYQILKRIAKRAGIAGRFNPHSFRHGFAREYLRNGSNLPAVAKILGHRNPSTTMNFYSIFDIAELATLHERYSPVTHLKGGEK